MDVTRIDELYSAVILDHCRSPRNPDELEHPTVSARAVNPFCGDEVDLQMALDDGRVSQVGATGRGCSINQAATSMLSASISGKTPAEIDDLAHLFRRMMSGETLAPGEAGIMGDLQALVGVRDFPVRIKCALLAWTALDDALRDYRKGRSG